MEVGLRLPDGSRVTRRFHAPQHTVGHLAALAASHGVDMSRHRLAVQFPRKVSTIAPKVASLPLLQGIVCLLVYARRSVVREPVESPVQALPCNRGALWSCSKAHYQLEHTVPH